MGSKTSDIEQCSFQDDASIPKEIKLANGRRYQSSIWPAMCLIVSIVLYHFEIDGAGYFLLAAIILGFANFMGKSLWFPMSLIINEKGITSMGDYTRWQEVTNEYIFYLVDEDGLATYYLTYGFPGGIKEFAIGPLGIKPKRLCYLLYIYRQRNSPDSCRAIPEIVLKRQRIRTVFDANYSPYDSY